ncbi:hypothetical protein E1B28_003244 [Marasmius oreades]|uniref:Uncharacterized protein n=1 Tax=Marasmius oreades TaxID=181124 RepID=A0A9P7UN83_9AGAR|nr:uncharacterized protein E1B28_003244 [Marasmius oreades]KAG7085699.1 hypothetical protein E1B28_003244 [Marasmius oreades]
MVGRDTTDASEYRSTSHGSPEIGSSVTFRFNGTLVQVFGTIHTGTPELPPTAIFILDSKQQSIFKGSPSNDTQYSQLFYNSGILLAAEHALTMILYSRGPR